MRQELIELLAFPRYQLRGELDLQSCVHDGRYDASDPKCLMCEKNNACHWLYDNDEFAALSARSVPDLCEALAFVVEHVDTLVLSWGHDTRHCVCDACEWLRVARKQARVALEAIQ